MKLKDILLNCNPLMVSIAFILSSIIISTSIYILISVLIDKLVPHHYILKLFAKGIKAATSFLITNKLKQTIEYYTMDENTSVLILALLSLLNLISIIISNHQYNYYNIWLGIANMSIITISIFGIITNSNYIDLNYYIDGKLITLVYLVSIFTNSVIMAFVFNLLMSLKLISIYNSTHFIIKNNVKQNYLYLFLIYLNIIDRYIDINQMLY